MAKTFYGYAEREAGSYVDWSQIGKDITDMLQEEVVRRETLKKELADASTAYGETLANAPTGLHEGANDAIISFADNAQQARLMQDRLLKSGQLKVKDYLLQRENLTQGTKGIFNVAKNFQEKVAYKVERMKNNESQYLEQYLFELTEGFGNFNKAGIYINPTNFEVSAAKKIQKTGPNGEVYYEMSNDPKDFLTTNEMNNFISVDLNRFDDTKAVEDLSNQVGARLQQDYIYDKGRKSFITRAISDASGDVFRKMVEQGELTEDEINLVNRFRGQVDKEFDSWLSNPFNITSTLTESLGEKFTFVWKEEDQKGNPNAILLEKDPNSGFVKPVFNTDEGKAQIDKIKEVWGERLRLRLDQNVTEVGKQETVRPRVPETDAEKKQNKARQAGDALKDVFIKDLIYGDDDQKERALRRLKLYNSDIIDYQFRTENGVKNLYQIVPDANSATKEKAVLFIEDFNNRSPEEIGSTIIFSESAKVMNAKNRENYTDAMAATGLGLSAAQQYHPNETQNRVWSAVGNPAAGKSQVDYVSIDNRTSAQQQYANFTGGMVYDKLVKNSTKSSQKAADGFATAYMTAPKGGTIDNNPMNAKNLNLNSINKSNSKLIHDDSTLLADNSELIEFRLPPEIGPSFVLPVHSSYGFQSASKEIAKIIDSKIIEYRNDPGNTSPITLNDIKTQMGNYGGNKDYFDKFQTGYQNMLSAGGQSIVKGPLASMRAGATTKTPFRPYDPTKDASMADYVAKKKAYENQ